jgi:hypothetical protein
MLVGILASIGEGDEGKEVVLDKEEVNASFLPCGPMDGPGTDSVLIAPSSALLDVFERSSI